MKNNLKLTGKIFVNFVGNKLEKEIFKEKLLKFFVKRSET
jgi:hypothetical protein